MPDALGQPRQQARFLCGLTSPALTRARLSSNPLFGILAAHHFDDVLAWCDRARYAGGQHAPTPLSESLRNRGAASTPSPSPARAG